MLAVVLALGAAAVFGTATALQHRAASGVSRADGAGGRLMARLLRQPGWLLGLCLSGLAFALHVAALHEGPLSLVQPVVVTTTVFAVLVSSALERTVPDRVEVLWCVCTCAGLTLFVEMVRAHPPSRVPDDRTAAGFVVAAAAAAGVALLVATRTKKPARRGFVLGVAAGVLYGLTAGLIKVSTSQVRLGLAPLVGHWSTWLVAPAGLSAFLLSQRAYQATRLSVSAPAVNIVDVLVAVTFGSVVFADHLFATPGQLVLELVGLGMAGVGVWRLVLESERLHDRQAAAAALEQARQPVTEPE